MGATTIFNYLRRAGVVVIAEGLHLAETRVPDALGGRTLDQAAIPSQTGCNVVALRSETGMTINPDPSTILKRGDEIILIGTPESEQRFMKLYGAQTLRAEPIAPPGATVGEESQPLVQTNSTKP
jgi:Trk K+ transport system NAD-binding subunit